MHLTALLLAAVAWSADTTLSFSGSVPAGGPDHFFVPFDVPVGVREIEVRHDDGSDANILDWGLDDPDGWRGWGGGNTEPALVAVDHASRSYVPGPIPAGTWNVVVGKAKVLDPAAAWSVEVVLRERSSTNGSEPTRTPWVDPGVLRPGPGWFAGDFHVHSRESGDATATLDEIGALATAQGLDFVVITDHNTVTQADFLGDAQSRWPDLLFVPGTEYTTYQGHASAVGATAWVDHKLGQPGVTIAGAVAEYRSQGVFFSLNHPALDLGDLCIGCAWTQDVPDGVGGLELGTGAADTIGNLFTPEVIALWESLADEGRLLTAVGGSDDHRAGEDTGPFPAKIGNPVTMVRAEALSIPAILAALEAGDTVVKLQDALDPMAELVLDGRSATLTVTGGDGSEAWFVVDGDTADVVPVAGDPATLSFTVPEGATRVRAELWRGGARRTLTGFRAVVDAPTDAPDADAGDGGRGCGCDTGPRQGGPVLVLAMFALSRGRRPARPPSPSARRPG